MPLIDPKSITNGTASVVSSIMTKVIPAINVLDERLKALERAAGQTPPPARPAEAKPEVVAPEPEPKPRRAPRGRAAKAKTEE